MNRRPLLVAPDRPPNPLVKVLSKQCMIDGDTWVAELVTVVRPNRLFDMRAAPKRYEAIDLTDTLGNDWMLDLGLKSLTKCEVVDEICTGRRLNGSIC